MSDKPKHTAGPVHLSPESKRTIVDWFGALVGSACCYPGSAYYVSNEEEAEANAALFVEAINVSTETGMTLRQLADQRKELLDDAENLCSWASHMEIHDPIQRQQLRTAWDRMKATIAKAKGE